MSERNYEIDVSACGNKLWINSTQDGSCIARFSKSFGIDIHRSGTEQLAGKGECLFCTHEPAGEDAWNKFREQVKKHYGITVRKSLIRY